jgi:hypothetical protein
VSPRPEFSTLSSAEKDALIGRLLAQAEELTQRVVALEVASLALWKENLETARRRSISPVPAIRLTLDAVPLPDTG